MITSLGRFAPMKRIQVNFLKLIIGGGRDKSAPTLAVGIEYTHVSMLRKVSIPEVL